MYYTWKPNIWTVSVSESLSHFFDPGISEIMICLASLGFLLEVRVQPWNSGPVPEIQWATCWEVSLRWFSLTSKYYYLTDGISYSPHSHYQATSLNPTFCLLDCPSSQHLPLRLYTQFLCLLYIGRTGRFSPRSSLRLLWITEPSTSSSHNIIEYNIKRIYIFKFKNTQVQ